MMCIAISAQNGIGEVFDTPAPSEETWKEMEQISHNPSLRAKPPTESGDGGAQKVPIGDSTPIQIGILGLLSIGLTLYRKNQTSKHNLQ